MLLLAKKVKEKPSKNKKKEQKFELASNAASHGAEEQGGGERGSPISPLF